MLDDKITLFWIWNFLPQGDEKIEKQQGPGWGFILGIPRHIPGWCGDVWMIFLYISSRIFKFTHFYTNINGDFWMKRRRVRSYYGSSETIGVGQASSKHVAIYLEALRQVLMGIGGKYFTG